MVSSTSNQQTVVQRNWLKQSLTWYLQEHSVSARHEFIM